MPVYTFRDAIFNYTRYNEGAIAYTVYVGRAPIDAVMPYIIIQRISSVASCGLSGQDGIVDEVWQIDVYAETSSAAETIADAMNTKYNGTALADVLKTITDGSITPIVGEYDFDILDTYCSMSDQVSERQDGGEDNIYRVIVEARLSYRRKTIVGA